MAIMINAKPDYKPAMLSGDGWREVGGKMAQSFLSSLTWTKVGASERLANRTVDDTSSRDEVAILPIYLGEVSGRVAGVLFGDVKNPYRIYAVADKEAADAVIAQLQRNKGFMDEQLEAVGDILTNNNATGLYSWENDFFGDSKNLFKAWRVSGVSHHKAKTYLEGTKAQLVTEAEAAVLLKKLAKKYNIYNVELTFMPFDGKLLGFAKATEDSITPGIKPVGIEIHISRDVIYLHTILHEFSHAIELFHNGIGGHGKAFRKIYKQLIKEEMGLNAIGL